MFNLRLKEETETETETETPRSALILGEDTRSFLSVVRSLGRAGYTVHVVCYDRASHSLSSKYIASAFFYNYQAYDNQGWIDNVLCLIERYQYSVVFPCDERAIYPLWQARGLLPKKTKLAVANPESLDVLFDKWKTKQVATKCRIPVAQGDLISPSQHSYEALTNIYGNKFVLKPLQSFEMSCLDKRNKVVIVRSRNDYEEFTNANPASDHCLIEEYFSGKGEGLSVFAVDGKVVTAFSYKRLAEPDTGGGSSYRGSTEIDSSQLQATQRICQETRLSGLAMFEFRRNEETSEWILVEINARVWGGLPLADYAGFDFPKLYADYLCSGKVDERQHKPIPNVTARSLTADLYEIKRESEKIANVMGRTKARAHMTQRLFGILKCVASRESIDSFRLDDPKPFFSEVKDVVDSVLRPALNQRRFIVQYRRKVKQKEIRQLFATNPYRNVIFICYGNIIRSPFAEQYFRSLLSKNAISLGIDSFGFHHKELRSSPDIAVEAASQLRCDLSIHSSKCLTQLDIGETDIIIYFDDKNRHALASGYRTNHAFCAADLLDARYSRLHEIADPYESDVKTIRSCYDKIKNALDNFLTIYQEAVE